MRLLLSILFVILLSTSANAFNPMITGQGNVSAGAADCQDGCPASATYIFCYGADYDSGGLDNSIACVNGGAGTDDADAEVGIDYDAGIFNSGAYSVKFNANNDRIVWNITTRDIFNPAQGFIEFHLYPDSHTGGSSALSRIVAAGEDSNLTIKMMDETGVINVVMKIDNTDTAVNSTTGITDDQFNQVQIRWKSGAGETIDIRVCPDNLCDSEGWDNDADGDPITDWTDTPDYVKIGEEFENIFDTFYVDDYTIWDTYDQS